MRGKIAQIVIPTAVCALIYVSIPHNANAIDESEPYRVKYEELYPPRSEEQPQSSPLSQIQDKTQQTLTIEEMLAIKGKIKKADEYTSRDLPGNAFVQLLEAEEIAGEAFSSEIISRLDDVIIALDSRIDVYRINVRVVDRTQSGRAEYIKSALVNQSYTPGIELVASGGSYTLTIDMQTLVVDEKETVGSHVILIPTGTINTMNGEYVALQERIKVECADYFADQQAARGSGVAAVGNFLSAGRAVDAGDPFGAAMGIARFISASSQFSEARSSGNSCDDTMAKLDGTPMYTADTQTTPFSYEERKTRKTATLGVQFFLATQRGTELYTSYPTEFMFTREDMYRPDIPAARIQGDPLEEISDGEVTRGVLNSLAEIIRKEIRGGGALWDLIAVSEAKKLKGEKALEAYMQLCFDTHDPAVQGYAREYIIKNSFVPETRLRFYMDGIERLE